MKAFSLIFFILIGDYAYADGNSEYKYQIQRFYNKKMYCIGPIKWPVSIITDTDNWINAQMESLVEVDLVKFKLEEGKKIWELSEKGKREFTKEKGFCYGPLKVKSIEKINLNRNGITQIIFKYTIESIPDWAMQKSVRFANTELDNLISGINHVDYQVLFKQDNLGNITMYSEPEQINLYY